MLKLLAIHNLNLDGQTIFDILVRLMEHVEKIYNLNIVSHNVYNQALSSLENITYDYTKFFSIKKDTILKRRLYLNNVIEQIIEIAKLVGTPCVNDMFYLLYHSYNLGLDYLKELNSIFIPIKAEIGKKSNKPSSSNVYGSFKIYKYNSNQSMTMILNGASIYVEYRNKIIQFNGYFIKDTLNIHRNMFKQKISSLQNLIVKNKAFTKGYINQLSLRDFVMLVNKDIISICDKKYRKIKKIKDSTISSIVKNFLNMKVPEQIEYLTLFLLMKEDNEYHYLAYMLYDMISNESFLLKPQPLSEQVYINLHFSIQKLFKVALKKVEKINNYEDFDENSLCYEKRIMIMKTSDNVKSKAFEKLKQIQNKNGENVSKAQQYLDGLLEIPFGIYLKEDLFNFITEFKEEFCEHLSNNNIYLDNSTTQCINLTSIEIDKHIIDIVKKHGKKLSYSYINKKYTIAKLKTILMSKNASIAKKRKSDMIHFILNNYDEIDEYLDDDDKLANKLFKLEKKWMGFKKDTKLFIKDLSAKLDRAVYGQDDAKKEIKRIAAQWINGTMKGYALGFEGPPGTGKTSLAKKGIAKCLKNRPFSFVALGGSTNGSTLEGHSYTYVGSTWGKIVDILRETKCMNPIIYIDELDKISATENGREIIGILTHLTDPSQNDEFQDKFFSGIKLDLSQVLFIFSYNDYEKLDPILADRIHRIQFKGLSKQDKHHIVQNYLMPEFLENVGMPLDALKINNDTIDFIIENYTYEAGLRKLKQKIFEIVREINLRIITDEEHYSFPFIINQQCVEDIFSSSNKIINRRISKSCHIGIVNGLYATSVGTGGITIIETFKTPNDSKLSLMITGQQGNVMQESVKCAKTIAWNLLPRALKLGLRDDLKEEPWGIHVHCPEASVPKDGPSAGAAITLALVSLFTGIPVKNTVALTGEIDLNGNVHVIGGLENKIDGAINAGVKLVCYPIDNKQDIEKMPIKKNINLVPVKTIWDVLEICLCSNKIKFNEF